MNLPSVALSFQHIEAELRLFHGPEALASLRREIERAGRRRALVVCGRSVAASPAMGQLRDALGPLLAEVCPLAQAHSPVPAVEAVAAKLGEVAADALVAVGGGSAVVTARAATILAAEGRPVDELSTRRLPDGSFESPRLRAAKLPVYVVPTTPSTAFVKAGSAVHDPASGRRLALFDPATRARGIFVVPDFLRTSPISLVRSATLNTLSTAVEALESSRCDPLSEGYLMQALRIISRSASSMQAGDPDARERLVLAAILCGRGTEQSGGGLASVLAHAAGTRSHASNGDVNAIMLPHTMRFNLPATASMHGRIAEALGGIDGSVAVRLLLECLSAPRRLRDIGIAREDLDAIAVAAMSDWFISRAPRRVDSTQVLTSLLEAAW